MSAILNKLQKNGSQLTELDGKKPLEYDKQTIQIGGLTKSRLSIDGLQPLEYDKQTIQIKGLTKSQLDLNGELPSRVYRISFGKKISLIPNKYVDNPPK